VLDKQKISDLITNYQTNLNENNFNSKESLEELLKYDDL